MRFTICRRTNYNNKESVNSVENWRYDLTKYDTFRRHMYLMFWEPRLSSVE